ncbi:uncharacterized protein LOC131170216 [Hevea brasiliensis]|uniref:uncharacterized protein LOC131170216 n=1 Tax=Hevea brasiliensis TaxID=3981 RepID=UPI0025F182E6|nr:uncharacterized protein LOC131170216 [Hevea brasiliensis]
MDCPKLKKPFKKFKKKALKATWDESSDSEDEEISDQIAQMCFMAMEESSNEIILNDDIIEFSYDELVNALKVMNDELELSHKENKLLKKELVSLRKENETSTKNDKPLGKDKLDAILDSQRSLSIKHGLRYSKFAHAPPSKTIFVCLKSLRLESKWYLDCGCSRHMIGNADLFLSLEKKDGGRQVTFGDNGKDVKCFVSISDDSQTWYRRLAHANMDLLANLNNDELVDRLPKIKFQKDKDNLDKFSSKRDEGVFLGYSISSKAYRVFNKRTLAIEESMHAIFDEANPFDPRKDIPCDDDVVGNFDELTLGDPQSSGNQDELKEDPLKDLGND